MSTNVVLPRFDPKKPQRIIRLNRGRDGSQWLEEVGADKKGLNNHNRLGGVSGRIVLADAGIVRGDMVRLGGAGRVKIVGRGIETKEGKAKREVAGVEGSQKPSEGVVTKVYGKVEPIARDAKAECLAGEGQASMGERSIRGEWKSEIEKAEWDIEREIGEMCDKQIVREEEIKEWVLKAGLEKAKERAEYLRIHGSGREGFVERLEGVIAKEESDRAKEERLSKYMRVAEHVVSKSAAVGVVASESEGEKVKGKRGKKKKSTEGLTERAKMEGDGNELPLTSEEEKESELSEEGKEG